MKARNTPEYQSLSPEETLRVLGTSPAGLTSAQAQRLARTYGFNEIAVPRRNPFLSFFSRYWGPMPWLLEIAIILASFLQHYLEAGIIFALLTVNAIIGYVQRRSSQKALEALKKRLAVKARVLRDGKWATVEAREIVPGDIITLGLGDIIPADTKLISGHLSVDQSVLTGESLPRDVEAAAVVYSSSIVKRGEARGVVVNTGSGTYFGRTAELVRIARPKSHQEQIMLTIVRYMLFLGLAALVLVAAFAVTNGTGILTILTFAVIFLMGAVPVALPAVLTIVQTVGATQMAHKGALVTRLDSIEDAASIDILCLDKTGTITQNRLSITGVIPFRDGRKEDVILTAALASQEQGKDAIDAAVLDYARTALQGPNYQPESFTPFEPVTKRSEAIAVVDGKRVRAVKGAPQAVLALCRGLDEKARETLTGMVETLSLRGDRTLAVARSEGEDLDNLKMMGLLALSDPPRPESKNLIEAIRRLGIKPIMLTGDNIAIAREIARQVSLGDRIRHPEELKDKSEAEQARLIEESDGFAEIYPEDKYRIVKLLQSRGHLVGMTGDGVNDAPALKQAEMGIAVSEASDVAKASASVVLTEPGIEVIVHAIETSRHIYQRMLTWVINKVTKTVQLIGLLTLGFFWFQDTVISLLGMSLLIFANDFVTMSLATDNVQTTANPNKWNVRNVTFAALIIGALLVGEGAAALFIGTHYFHLEWEALRTFMMLMLIFTSLFRVYIVRERRFFWSSVPGRELLIATLAALVGFTLLGVYGKIVTPLTVYQALILLAFSALFTLVIDFPKYWAFKKFGL